MDDPLDKDLKNRIREVFENYEDTSADEGWLLLREKFPEKVKRRPVAWLWWASAAAILLVFLGIGIWLANKPVSNNNTAFNKKKGAQDTGLYTKVAPHDTVNNLTDSAIINRHKQAYAASRKALGHDFNGFLAKSGLQKPDRSFIAGQQMAQVDIEPDLPGQQTANVNKTQAPAKVSVNVDNVTANTPTNKENIDKQETYAAAPIVKNESKTTGTAAAENEAVKAKVPAPSARTNELFANDNNVQEDRKTEKLKSTSKAVRFSVYAATYFNYAKGSNNQLNVGAGFTSDIRITRNLRLSTGVSIGQNTLNYATQIPLSTSSSNTLAVTSNIAASAYKAQGQLLETSPALKNYNANLVGLDIPVNLKYLFNPEKNDAYVSAGLSSGTFINETYTYNYSYPTPVNSSSEPTKDVASKNNFNGFYFGKTLNFAFGLGYPLGKTNRLIIEPFLKYPLDGLGSQQLKFGAGGVNLKFNFKGQK